MKALKLSLVAALAVGSFSALNAKPLEEAIKNVDLSGDLRYRYDSSTARKAPQAFIGAGVAGNQDHRFRARFGAKADIGDGFKIFGQIHYDNDKNRGFGDPASAGQGRTQTGNPFALRQAYLQYDMADYGLNFIWGRQELGTIWTDDFVGTAAKVVYSPYDGLAIAAFAVDSFEEDTDGDNANFGYILGDGQTGVGVDGNPQYDENHPNVRNMLTSRLYKYNMYGAAVLSGFDLGGSSLDFNLWFAQLMNTATFYAADFKYTLPLADDLAWSLRATYLGNSVDSYFKNKGADAGNFVNVYGDIKGYGFDGGLGGVYYGKKDKITINTIEDVGSFGLSVGKEFMYSRGSWIVLSQGQTTAGYVNVGYTLPSDFRIGLQGVYGGTKTGANGAAWGGGDKLEGVVEASYKYSANLDFLTWYSYLNYSGRTNVDNETKNTFRIQARYTF